MQLGDVKGQRLFGEKSKQSEKTYKELYEEFIKILEIKGRAKETLKSYYYHNSYFMNFLNNKNFKCKDINVGVLEDYIRYIKEKKGIDNPVTINSYLHNISPVVHYGQEKGYIIHKFMIPQVKGQETFKDIYTSDELNTLLTRPKKNDFTTIRTYTMLWVLSSTGIRARELRELKIKNINVIDRTMVVNVTKNKKPRIIPLSTSLVGVMQEWLELRQGDGEDYLFPSVYNGILARSTLQKCIKVYANERGIDKTSLHLFRHTFITNAVNTNVSPLILKRITGHSNLATLNKYYNARVKDIIEVIDDITPHSNRKENYFKKKK